MFVCKISRGHDFEVKGLCPFQVMDLRTLDLFNQETLGGSCWQREGIFLE